MLRFAVAIFFCVVGVLGCGSHDGATGEHHHGAQTTTPSANECAYCGMRVETAAPFSVTHESLRFDSVKCFLGYTLEHTNTERDAAIAREYYSGEAVALRELGLVIDSDVMGPMGRDFIAVRRSEVERFVRDHHGHVVETPLDQIAATSIQALFQH